MPKTAHETIQLGALFISPGLLGSRYFEDIAEVLAGDGPPNIERIGDVMRRHGLTPAPPA